MGQLFPVLWKWTVFLIAQIHIIYVELTEPPVELVQSDSNPEIVSRTDFDSSDITARTLK